MYAKSTRSSAKRAMRMCPRSGQIFLFLFLLHFSHYYYILNNIHSLPLINISRERTNFDARGYLSFYSRYYRGRAYSLTNAWKLDFLPWNWCRNHVLSTRVERKNICCYLGYEYIKAKNSGFATKTLIGKNGLKTHSVLPERVVSVWSISSHDYQNCHFEPLL